MGKRESADAASVRMMGEEEEEGDKLTKKKGTQKYREPIERERRALLERFYTKQVRNKKLPK